MNKREQLLHRVIDFFRQALASWFYPTNGWQVLLLGLLLVLSNDLLQHMELWKVTQLDILFPVSPALTPELWVVANHPDPPYILALAVGAGISLLSLDFLIFKVRRSQ